MSVDPSNLKSAASAGPAGRATGQMREDGASGTNPESVHADPSPGPAEQWTDHRYEQLRLAAVALMRGESPGHTLQATAVAHEAYLRLCDQRKPWSTGDEFRAVAATTIRRVLADYARRKQRLCRGGDRKRVDWSLAVGGGDELDSYFARNDAGRLVELSDMLERLATLDPVHAAVVDMKVFGNQTFAEIGEALDMSSSKAHQDWHTAKAWLLDELSPDS